MIRIARHGGQAEPPWWRPAVVTTEDGRPRMTAWVCCPAGHLASLAGHAIGPAGEVAPSVVCRECGWRQQVRLLGWR